MRVGSRLAGCARLGSLYLFCRRRVYQRRLPPKLAPAERADVGFNGNMNAKRGSGACPRGVCHFRFLEVACSRSGGLPQDGLRWGQLQARVVRLFYAYVLVSRNRNNKFHAFILECNSNIIITGTNQYKPPDSPNNNDIEIPITAIKQIAGTKKA
jgi:hypothetical protein